MRRPAHVIRPVAPILGLALAVVVITTCGESPIGNGDDPLIAVSNTTVGMTVTQGDPTMRSATVTISNTGGGTLTGLSVSVSYGGGMAGFLTASLNSTTAPATLTLQASGNGMTVGSHPATVTVQSPVATNGSVSISVTCTVTAPATNPAIGLSNTSLAFAAQTTGAEPPVQTVSVTNAGTGSLTGLAAAVSYQSGQPTGWLSASLSATTAPATLTVQASKTGLAAGTYNATIDVTSGVANNSPQAITVTFTVTQPPAIGLSETSLSFASVGVGVPAAQTVTVSNAGGGALTGLATTIAYGAGQPTGWLSTSFSGTTAPATLTVQASPGGLNSGTYQATIDVTSNVASNSPQRLLVTYTKSGLTGPNLNVPSVAGTNVQLSWTFGFPPIASSNDGYRLEESTTGPTSGFVTIGSYLTRQSPFVVNVNRGGGTYWYRVRAVTALGTTDYSQVQSAVVSVVTATRFQNNAAWSVVYLTIDGVQQFSYLEGIPTGYYY
ncbi:MAG: choice-of-anchor D domain-containing protein, partial [Gemmatimonadota bacterium]|nr:choice-of-anchor D domain-containing protein [Gemmatimonadota bacterium]